MRGAWILAGLSVFVAGCSSPEAARQRGGGPGADVGNRPAQVLMHEGSQQYWKTPVRIGTKGASIAPSEQARRMSLRSRAKGGDSARENSPDAPQRDRGR